MESIVDRAAARQHLELANKQVAESHRRVEAQVGLVARLARGGHDTFQARMLLGQFETSLALQVEGPRLHRARTRRKQLNYCGQMILERAPNNCSSGGRGLR
jgi:hypothetical protein